MQKIADSYLETRILGNIIVRPDSWYEIASDFDPKYFSDPELATIAKIMVDVTKAGRRPSSTALLREFQKNNIKTTPKDLIDIIGGFITVKDTKPLMRELIDLYKRRTVYQTLGRVLNSLEKVDKPTDELIASAQQAMIDAFSQTGGGELASMHDVCDELFSRQVMIQNGETPPVYPLNLAGLQGLMGGLESGSLNIVAGRPSMGKTSFNIPIPNHLIWFK